MPQNAVSYYRHGQALESLGQIDDAIDMYNRVIELLQEGEQHLPDKHWLRAMPFVRMGYLRWQQSLPSTSREATLNDRLDLIAEAFGITEKALPFAEDGTAVWSRIHNNLLYYAVEYIDLLEEDTEPMITEDGLNRSLRVLESNIDIDDSANSYQLDTLCRAFVHVGRTKDAVRVAKRIEWLLDRPELRSEETEPRPETFYHATKPLSVAERRILVHALWVLRHYNENGS